MMTIYAGGKAAVVTLALLLLVSVITDLRSRRVPNKLVLIGLILAFVLHGVGLVSMAAPLAGGNWWSPLTGLLTAGGGLLLLYVIGAAGAGDVKLMAMVGAFVGPETGLLALLFTLASGGVLALLFMLTRRASGQVFENLRFLLTDLFLRVQNGGGARIGTLASTAVRLPYAVAITAGSMLALWVRYTS